MCFHHDSFKLSGPACSNGMWTQHELWRLCKIQDDVTFWPRFPVCTNVCLFFIVFFFYCFSSKRFTPAPNHSASTPKSGLKRAKGGQKLRKSWWWKRGCAADATLCSLQGFFKIIIKNPEQVFGARPPRAETSTAGSRGTESRETQQNQISVPIKSEIRNQMWM